MDSLLYTAFVLASVILIIVPGPNVLVVVSTSIAHGTKRGLQTVLGTSSAMLIQLLMAALGTAWLVDSLAAGFTWLRWFGVAYLVYLGISHLLVISGDADIQAISAASSYGRGFVTSLTNPKTILFFSAFLPQFVSRGGDYTGQILVLSATFLLLATALDGLYAVLSGYFARILQAKPSLKIQNSICGILYMGAGAWLAALRKN